MGYLSKGKEEPLVIERNWRRRKWIEYWGSAKEINQSSGSFMHRINILPPLLPQQPVVYIKTMNTNIL